MKRSESRVSMLDTGGETVVIGSSRFLVHPQNIWRIVWDGIVLLSIWLQVCTIPFTICFDLPNPVLDTEDVNFWTVEEIGTCAIGLVDIVLNFFTGRFSGDGGILHMNYRYVWRDYMEKWFLLDLVSNFPWFLFEIGVSQSAFRPIRLLRVLRIARLTKVLRLKTVLKRVEHFVQQDLLYVVYSILKYIAYLLIAVHVLACVLWAMSKTEGETHWPDLSPDVPKTLFEQYIMALYYASTTAMTVGYGDFHPNNHNERFFQIFVLLTSGIAYAILSAMMAGLIISYDKTSQKFTIQMKSAIKYMVANGVDQQTQRKVRDYLENILESKLMSKTREDLYNLISPQLQIEVNMSIYGSRLKKLPFFRKIPEDVLGKVTCHFQTLYLAPGDVVFREGHVADQLFFVIKGTVIETGPYWVMTQNADLLREGGDDRGASAGAGNNGSVNASFELGRSLLARLSKGRDTEVVSASKRRSGVPQIFVSPDGNKGKRCVTSKSWPFLGETSLFVDETWRTTAECGSFCEVLVLSRDLFKAELEKAEDTFETYKVHAAFVACSKGYVEEFRTLYAELGDVDVADLEGSNLLHVALRYDQIDCGFAAVSREISGDARDPRSGKLPIHAALERNLVELAVSLVERTSDFTMSSVVSSEGHTVVELVARKLPLEEIALFAFAMATAGKTKTLIQLVSLEPALIDFEKEGCDLLTTAIMHDNADTATELMSKFQVCSHKHALRLAYKVKAGQVVRALTVTPEDFREVVTLPVEGQDDFKLQLVKKARALKLDALADDIKHHMHQRHSSTPKMSVSGFLYKRKKSFSEDLVSIEPSSAPVRVPDKSRPKPVALDAGVEMLCMQLVYGCVIDAVVVSKTRPL